MNENDIAKIFELVRAREAERGWPTARLRHLPFEDLGFAKVDHHRALRQGFAEVVFARGKTREAGGGNCARAVASFGGIGRECAGDARGRKNFCGGETCCARREISRAFWSDHD